VALDRGPIPYQDQVVVLPPTFLNRLKLKPEERKYIGILTGPYLEYLTRLSDTVDTSNARVGSVEIATQGASITATDFSGGNIKAGLYQISYSVQITRAATTSSSITVTFQWTRNGVTQTFARAAVTGNTTATHDEFVIPIKADVNSPVTYATTYASVGATSMQYELAIVLSKIRA
jgi:hypothetical protein